MIKSNIKNYNYNNKMNKIIIFFAILSSVSLYYTYCPYANMLKVRTNVYPSGYQYEQSTYDKSTFDKYNLDMEFDSSVNISIYSTEYKVSKNNDTFNNVIVINLSSNSTNIHILKLDIIPINIFN